MALTSFVANLTKITAAWLNKIDVLYVTVFDEAATKAAARAALTSDGPMAVGEGGTGAKTAGAARTALGSTATGDSVFTAASAAAARSAIGAAASGANADITSIALQGLADLSHASAGQVKFPATPNPSADVNTLDDYEEGPFTPSFTFAIPGDLSVTYGTRSGYYTKIGRMVFISISMTLTAFTHTTASGTARITGLPFTVLNDGIMEFAGGCSWWRGITKANFTDVGPLAVFNQTYLHLGISGSGQTPTYVAPGDMPTGGTPEFKLSCMYIA